MSKNCHGKDYGAMRPCCDDKIFDCSPVKGVRCSGEECRQYSPLRSNLPISQMAKSESKPRPATSRPADQYVNSSFFYKMEKEIEERRQRIEAL